MKPMFDGIVTKMQTDEDPENSSTQIVSPESLPHKKKQHSSWWEIIRFALIAFLIVVPIRVFVAQPFIVSGSSMIPTFQDGDYLVIDELTYRFKEPTRGDVVIFHYPKDPSKFYIKRIIGLPGEKVHIDKGIITITTTTDDKITLDETFIAHQSTTTSDADLKDGEYFVMGDNRSASSDSRSWGPLPSSFIKGRPFVRLLPVERLGIFPGRFSF